jgi:hypothetical protein
MIINYNKFENNLYLSIVVHIQNKMSPSDYHFLASRCLEIEQRIEEIQKR